MRFAQALIMAVSFTGTALAGGGGERICETCLDIDSTIRPTPNWHTVSGSTIGQPNNEYSYQFMGLQGGSYRFTFCEGGGWADYDTALSVQGPDNCGTYIVCNDDYCSLQSQIDFIPATNGNFVLVVDGYSSSAGNYALAYRGPGDEYGACCRPDGSCYETWEPDCSGEFMGEGTTCEPNPCGPVAVRPAAWGRIKSYFR